MAIWLKNESVCVWFFVFVFVFFFFVFVFVFVTGEQGCPREEQISLVCQEGGVGFSQSAIVSGNKLYAHTFGDKTNRL